MGWVELSFPAEQDSSVMEGDGGWIGGPCRVGREEGLAGWMVLVPPLWTVREEACLRAWAHPGAT